MYFPYSFLFAAYIGLMNGRGKESGEAEVEPILMGNRKTIPAVTGKKLWKRKSKIKKSGGFPVWYREKSLKSLHLT